MLYLLEVVGNEVRDYNFHDVLDLLDDIYSIEEQIVVVFVPPDDLIAPGGIKAKGNCGIGSFVLRGGGTKFLFMIKLVEGLGLVEAATILVHEYAHILSQQSHKSKMLELWREYLRSEFVKRWDEWNEE